MKRGKKKGSQAASAGEATTRTYLGLLRDVSGGGSHGEHGVGMLRRTTVGARGGGSGVKGETGLCCGSIFIGTGVNS
jgi:hypothetical protein